MVSFVLNSGIYYFIIMKLFKYKALKISIVVFILGIGSFTFLHSELGLFNCENSHHGTHDFCEIVQTEVSLKIQRIVQPAPECLCLYCSEVELFSFKQNTRVCLSNSGDHIILKNATFAYLFNASFLI